VRDGTGVKATGRETKRAARGPNRFLRAIDRAYCRLWQRLEGPVHALPDGPLILVGNHRSGVDPLLVQASVNRPLCFLMAREHYQSMWYLRWLLDACGVIPVNPGGANRHALAEAIEAVRDGNALCLFPEGEANPAVPLKRMLPGAIVIAMETGAPIIPFRVTGAWPYDHVHMWRPFFCRGRGRVRFGEPMRLPEGLADRQDIRRQVQAMREAIHAVR